MQVAPCLIRTSGVRGYWEQHCEAHLVSSGFQVIPDWPSTLWYPKWQLFLVVYVDKLADKSENLQLAWARSAEGIQMDPPTKMGLFLGCEHEPFEVTHPHDNSRKLRGMVYNVMGKLQSLCPMLHPNCWAAGAIAAGRHAFH